MKAVTAGEIKAYQDYEIARPQVRERVMGIKSKRRVAVGEHLTLLFENRDTVIYQIQEMTRAEHMSDPREIARELAVYNELVPGTDELSATLLIEYEDPVERDRELRRLLGLEKYLRLEVEGVGSCKASFDMRQMSTDRISSVHYLRFPLGKALADAIRAGKAPRIVVDHPNMQVQTTCSAEQTAALAEDLRAA